MRDQSHHGGRGRFVAGLALAIALFAPACVAGEVADEAETDGPVASAGVADVPAKTVDPLGDEVREGIELSAAEQTEETDTGAPCAGSPRTAHVDVGRRRCPRGHKGTADVLSDPPPSPWKR